MRYLANLIAAVLILSLPIFAFAQESDGDPDLISYAQFSRMSHSDQDQYLEDLREALITLTTTPNRYGLPLVVENGFSTMPSGRAMAALTILNFLSEVAEAKACHDVGNQTICDVGGAPPPAAANPTTRGLNINATQQLAPTVPPLLPVRQVAPVVKASAPAVKNSCRQFNGETFCTPAGAATAPSQSAPARASRAAKPMSPAQTAPSSKASSACPAVPSKDLQILRTKYRSSDKSECIYGGYISHEINKEGPMTSYAAASAKGCRPVRQDQYEGQNFKCASAKQVLCNPLLFGLSGTGTAVCVDPQAHATRACGDQAKSESVKYGKAYQDFQTQFRQMGSVQEHWKEFSTNLNKLCSDKDFGGVHCDECNYFHDKMKAAAARAKTLRQPPGVQPSADIVRPTVG